GRKSTTRRFRHALHLMYRLIIGTSSGSHKEITDPFRCLAAFPTRNHAESRRFTAPDSLRARTFCEIVRSGPRCAIRGVARFVEIGITTNRCSEALVQREVTVMRTYLTALALVIAASQLVRADDKKDEPKPADLPVKATLVAKTTTYKLDLGGKSGEEFR